MFGFFSADNTLDANKVIAKLNRHPRKYLNFRGFFYSLVSAIDDNLAERRAVQDGADILLLYAQRHNDYSLPGDGVDADENLLDALRRGLIEETRAQAIRVPAPYAFIDEYRPSLKPEFDVLFMRSYLYVCQVARELGQAQMEHYEVNSPNNDMKAVWVNLEAAIAHNEQVLAKQEKSMGMSIQRETWLLRRLAQPEQLAD